MLLLYFSRDSGVARIGGFWRDSRHFRNALIQKVISQTTPKIQHTRCANFFSNFEFPKILLPITHLIGNQLFAETKEILL